MTTETLNCPYCNAVIGPCTGVVPGQRIVCPRCGDAFPLRSVAAITAQPHTPPLSETAITSNAAASSLSHATTNLVLPPRRSNRTVAAAVLAAMFLMAGSGLVFMLLTQEQRRAHDTSRPARRPGKQRGVPEDLPLAPAVAPIAPDKLAALGYLPAGVNFLFAARVPELLASPAGKQIVHAPITLGGEAHRLADLPGWLGMPLENLDHLVFAARLDDATLPPFALVFRTAQPYDQERLKHRLKATRVASAGKKNLYAFHTTKPDLPLFAWFADEYTVVLSAFSNQLERLPSQPVEDFQQLPEELRTLLKERREPAAPLWSAGHSRDWSKTSAVRFLNVPKQKDLAKLTSIRTFGIWVLIDDALSLRGVFACKDEAKTRALEDYIRALDGPEAHLKTAQDGRWLTLQFPIPTDFFGGRVER